MIFELSTIMTPLSRILFLGLISLIIGCSPNMVVVGIVRRADGLPAPGVRVGVAISPDGSFGVLGTNESDEHGVFAIAVSGVQLNTSRLQIFADSPEGSLPCELRLGGDLKLDVLNVRKSNTLYLRPPTTHSAMDRPISLQPTFQLLSADDQLRFTEAEAAIWSSPRAKSEKEQARLRLGELLEAITEPISTNSVHDNCQSIGNVSIWAEFILLSSERIRRAAENVHKSAL